MKVPPNVAFKSCRKDRGYELSAHECHNKVGIMSEKCRIFFELQVYELGDWVYVRNIAESMESISLVDCTFS